MKLLLAYFLPGRVLNSMISITEAFLGGGKASQGLNTVNKNSQPSRTQQTVVSKNSLSFVLPNKSTLSTYLNLAVTSGSHGFTLGAETAGE